MTKPPAASPNRGLDYGRILMVLGLFTAVLALAGAGVGWLVAQLPGLLGGLTGAAVTLAFFGTTVAAMVLGRKSGPQAQMRNLVITWIVKLVVLFVLLAVLEGATWLNTKVFGVAVLVGVLGSLVIEGRAVLTARIAPGDPI